ncbi:MAG: hypothetical protein QM756_31610 [Polyangiaceae bacterium]
MSTLRFSPLWLALLCAACGGARSHANTAEEPVSSKAPPLRHQGGDEDEDDAKAATKAKGAAGEKDTANDKASDGDAAAAEAQPAPQPAHDPALVRTAVDATAAAPDERARLGLRLAVVDQGPDMPWLIALVNRGTQALRVVPDLRTLSLEITPPAPEPESKEQARAEAAQAGDVRAAARPRAERGRPARSKCSSSPVKASSTASTRGSIACPSLASRRSCRAPTSCRAWAGPRRRSQSGKKEKGDARRRANGAVRRAQGRAGGQLARGGGRDPREGRAVERAAQRRAGHQASRLSLDHARFRVRARTSCRPSKGSSCC